MYVVESSVFVCVCVFVCLRVCATARVHEVQHRRYSAALSLRCT